MVEGLNTTGFKLNDKVKVIGDHDQAGFVGFVVGYDTNFNEPVIQESTNGPRYLVHADYLQLT